MAKSREMIGFFEALSLVRETVVPLPAEDVPLCRAGGRCLAGDVTAQVNSPTDNVSLKDGFALISADTVSARRGAPVNLALAGSRFAGSADPGGDGLRVTPGRVVKVTSGAVVPPGADAVVGSEYCEQGQEEICLHEPVSPGMNVLPRGTDIRAGEVVCRRGDVLTPGRVGMLAAAGVDRLPVTERPRVALVATGDEVVAPGRPLEPGQLYASNLHTVGGLAGGLRSFFVHLRASGPGGNPRTGLAFPAGKRTRPAHERRGLGKRPRHGGSDSGTTGLAEIVPPGSVGAGQGRGLRFPGTQAGLLPAGGPAQ